MQINKKHIAYNRSRRTDEIKYIVIHDTGNTGRGANAESHYKYFNGGNRGSSADFFVDSIQALQVNDYTKYNNSIGIEICINCDGNYSEAFENAVRLTSQLMSELNIDINHVVRHYDASRKNCPQSMSLNGWSNWHYFKELLGETEELTMEQYEELKQEIANLKTEIKKNSTANGGTMIYNYIDDNMPEWAREPVQGLVDKGILAGTDEGLGLNNIKLWTCVMLYRVIKFIGKMINVKI